MLKKRIIAYFDISQDGMVGYIDDYVRVSGLWDRVLAGINAGADEIFFSYPHPQLDDRLQDICSFTEEAASRLSLPFTVAANFTDLPCMQKILSCGADRVSLPPSSVKAPSLVNRAARLFGSSAIVVELDVLRTEDGSLALSSSSHEWVDNISPQLWIQELQSRGAGEILLRSRTHLKQEQMYDFELIKELSSLVNLPVSFVGSCLSKEEVSKLFRAGVSALLLGDMTQANACNIAEYKAYGLLQGLDLRPGV